MKATVIGGRFEPQTFEMESEPVAFLHIVGQDGPMQPLRERIYRRADLSEDHVLYVFDRYADDGKGWATTKADFEGEF